VNYSLCSESHRRRTEIVLAMVIASFKIEPLQDIYFELLAIAQPTVEGSSDGKHELPVKLSLISQSGD
jgi:hypothetical protein